MMRDPRHGTSPTRPRAPASRGPGAASLIAALLLPGCVRDCAGPMSGVTVAAASGRGWRATLRCEPRTKLGAGRGDLLERQGCVAHASLVVDGSLQQVSQELLNLSRDRDCARVRAFCRELPGRVVSREGPDGAAVAAEVRGASSVLLGFVTPEGYAFRRSHLPVPGPLDAALAAAPTPDQVLAELLSAGTAPAALRSPIGGALRGATLRRLRTPLLQAAARCAAPVEALENLAREDPASFDLLYANGWRQPRCAGARDALERVAPEEVSTRVRADLAATRPYAPPEALDPLVVSVGRLRVRGARADVEAIARATPASQGASEALWIRAVWAWSRVDPRGAARACREMLGASPAPVAPTPPPFDRGVPRWDPRLVVLARCVASDPDAPRSRAEDAGEP